MWRVKASTVGPFLAWVCTLVPTLETLLSRKQLNATQKQLNATHKQLNATQNPEFSKFFEAQRSPEGTATPTMGYNVKAEVS